MAAVEALPKRPKCPECHSSTFVRITLRSDIGRYCLCSHCTVVWHDDDPLPPPTDRTPDNDINAHHAPDRSHG